MKVSSSCILITGAARRIGRALAIVMAAEGAHLVLHYHQSENEAQKLKKSLEKKYKNPVHLIQADLRNISEVQDLAQQAWKDFGPIDVLINNASTFYSTPLGKVSESGWEDFFQVNVRAPFFLSESLGLKMKKRGKGSIINIADSAAQRPTAGYIPYCASKAALIAVSQGLARGLAPEVRVNTVLPGPVLWPEKMDSKAKKKVIDKTPLAKSGNPDDVVAAVKFLISGSDFTTGALLHVDGGRHLSDVM